MSFPLALIKSSFVRFVAFLKSNLYSPTLGMPVTQTTENKNDLAALTLVGNHVYIRHLEMLEVSLLPRSN